MIWVPICHHWGTENSCWCLHLGKKVLYYWCASWDLSTYFMICYLWHCQCSPSVQKDLCKISFQDCSQRNTSGNAQLCLRCFWSTTSDKGINSLTILWQEIRHEPHTMPESKWQSLEWHTMHALRQNQKNSSRHLQL